VFYRGVAGMLSSGGIICFFRRSRDRCRHEGDAAYSKNVMCLSSVRGSHFAQPSSMAATKDMMYR